MIALRAFVSNFGTFVRVELTLRFGRIDLNDVANYMELTRCTP